MQEGAAQGVLAHDFLPRLQLANDVVFALSLAGPARKSHALDFAQYTQ